LTGDGVAGGDGVGAIVANARTEVGVRSLRSILTGRSDSLKSVGALRFLVAKCEGMVTCSAEGIVSDVDNRRISLIVETYRGECECCYCGKVLLSELLRIVFRKLQVRW
jgi:hypothetical protein